MKKVRLGKDRGRAKNVWLESYHTFSFGDYQEPAFMGFRSIRVINEDRVQPGQGFGKHSHHDMEILSYVIEGALEHKDSMGTGSVLKPGDVQIMSAGKGVSHSEFNHSKSELVHFLQIWILPERTGLAPRYQEKSFSREEKLNRLKLIASRQPTDGCLRIYQDARIYASLLEQGQKLEFDLASDHGAWVQVIRGSLKVNGTSVQTGDGLQLNDETLLTFTADSETEFLFFDLA